jgi:uncharacterized protein YjbI with pentapeptide repeats
MTTSELRAVAVDRYNVPTLVASRPQRPIGDLTEHVTLTIGDKKLDALRSGNRVVLTATQHPPRPAPPDPGGVLTKRSYVTVDQLQRGPGRGRVGSKDCSNKPINLDSSGGGGLQFCDLVGAALANAELSRTDASSDMHLVDLTGADLRAAGLGGVVLDGASFGGVDASGSLLDHATATAASAPELSIRSTRLDSPSFFVADLPGASFEGSRISEASFAAANLHEASFQGPRTRLTEVDLAYSELEDADLRSLTTTLTSLFLSDLRDTTMKGGEFGKDREQRWPPGSGILCRTTMPDGDVNDRDCP